MSIEKKFTFFSHTSDVGVRAYGKTINELFEHAAQGIFSYLLVPVELNLDFSKKIKLKGNDYESLLVGWINELIYLAYKNKVFMTYYKVNKITKNILEGETWGRKILAGYKYDKEIKALTYHNLRIKELRNGYSVKMIFDV